ncbi:hypothetical protein APY04_2217 [Hyphomicrobium sulfonivorans]|uniref:Uncharacterized protein n=1 Tax=Hyphomicrobium sulfonivorans TaxID=121290 RepID=A0A120CUV3_HYPSL|nr:hypothetical protein APY04_2217 [Hyphomicrobium sulfonivorans]
MKACAAFAVVIFILCLLTFDAQRDNAAGAITYQTLNP